MSTKTFLKACVFLFGATAPVCAQELTLDVSDDALKPVLRSASLTATLIRDSEGTPSAQDVVAAARADYRRLLTALYSEGYYGGSVSIRIDGVEAAGLAPLDAPENVEAVTISVAPGGRFVFGQTGIGPLAQGTQLPEGFMQGSTARSGTIRDAVGASVDAWREYGHAKATPESQHIIARHDERTLDVAIGIDPGPRVSFGPLTVSGNEDVREEAIRRIIGYPEGEVFTPVTEENVADRLRRTGAFASVTLIEGEELDGTLLPMTLQVTEREPRRVGYGLEMSSVEGLTLSGYWMHRNFLGGAQRFRWDGDISGIAGETGGVDYSTGVTFSVPRPFAIDTELVATLGLKHEDEPDYRIDQLSGDVSFTRLFSDNREVGGGIGFVRARSKDDLGTHDYTLMTFPLNGSIDRRDNALDTKDGFYATLDLMPYIGAGDAGTGGRAFFDGRIYRSVGADENLTFALRGQLGSVIGSDLANTPPDFLFYSGGGDTVRGQPYKSLGVESGGHTSGGLSLAVMSFETRVDLGKSIGLVGFYDVGYVGETAIPFDNGDWQSGIGVGLRYNTGIGPIRLDLATPASGDNAGKTLGIYVGIGQAF